MKKLNRPAPDPVTDAATLEIDGRKYRLVYDFNAIADAEVSAGCNLLHGMTATMVNRMSAGQLRGLFFAALRRAHPTITMAAAAALVRLDTMPSIVEKLCECYALSFPAAKNPTAAVDAAAAAN